MFLTIIPYFSFYFYVISAKDFMNPGSLDSSIFIRQHLHINHSLRTVFASKRPLCHLQYVKHSYPAAESNGFTIQKRKIKLS